MNARSRAIAQLQLMMLGGALVGVLAKLALYDVSAFTFVWLQVAIGGALLTLYTFAWRRERIPPGLGARAWALLFCIGLLNFSVVRFTLLLSLERLPVNTHTFLQSFVGIVTIGMSVVLMRERPSRWQLLGALLAVVGVRVFFEEVPALQERMGVVYLAVAVLGLATTNNLARRLPILTEGRLSNNVLSCVALWIGGVPLVLSALVLEGWPRDLGATSWAIIAANGLVSIALGLTLFNHFLRTLRSYEASILSGSGLIFTALFAMPILGEYLGLRQVAGIACMLLGMSLAQLRPGETGLRRP